MAPRNFHAEYLARTAKAAREGRSVTSARGHTTVARPTGVDRVFGLSSSQQRSREKATEAAGLMRRRGYSLTKAARRSGTTPDAVRRYAGTALEQTPGGRWRAEATDQLARVVPIISGGIVYRRVAVDGSTAATAVSGYFHAVDRFLKDGLDDDLRRFEGVVIDGVLPDGRHVAFELEATGEVLEDLERIGALEGLVFGS